MGPRWKRTSCQSGAALAVVERIACRAADLVHALRERVLCVAGPMLEELDECEQFARVDDLDRPAGAGSVHLRGDRLRRGCLQGARLQILADAPRHFDLSAAYIEADAIESLGHRELPAFAACALACLDAHDMRERNELLLATLNLNPASLVRPARTVDDGRDRRCVVGLAPHLLVPPISGPDPYSHATESRDVKPSAVKLLLTARELGRFRIVVELVGECAAELPDASRELLDGHASGPFVDRFEEDLLVRTAERHRPRYADSGEGGAYCCGVVEMADLVQEPVAAVPGKLDRAARGFDGDTVETFRHGHESRT